MKLEDGMLLYHGSYLGITKIDLDCCSVGKDFGKGFYLTEDKLQAVHFIKTSLKKAKNLKQIPENQRAGYVSVFRYHESTEAVPVYRFKTADRNWLWFISMNRRAFLAERFSKRLEAELLGAEIVIGKIANDTTNPTIAAYLNGLYGDVESDMAVDFAIHQLMPDRLKTQYCFLSEKAIACLEPVEVIRYEQ